MLIKVKPTSPSKRHLLMVSHADLHKGSPEKGLLFAGHKKRQGRGYLGHVTVRHRGGGEKKKLRMIDWKRSKRDITGVIVRLEYDPMRGARVALVHYPDGDKKYMLAPLGIKMGEKIIASDQADPVPGNAMMLKNIPVGIPIHNIEMFPGKGAQLVRGAGNAALVQAKDEKFVTIQLPSKEQRLLPANCYATIGQVGNSDRKNQKLGKAGRSRWLGIRPAVRGTAMQPNSHPHGGGEGRTGAGLKFSKTPWGKNASPGKKTRSIRKSQKHLVRDRRAK